MTYSINGGPSLTLDTANSGILDSDLLPTDLYFYGPELFNAPGWLQAGDVVVLEGVDRLQQGTKVAVKMMGEEGADSGKKSAKK